MALKLQICKSCETEFTDKTWIDACPICRGTNIRRMMAMTDDELYDELLALRNSCMEGYDGTWDPTGEGRESFLPMSDAVERIAAHLGIALPEYENKEDDDE